MKKLFFTILCWFFLASVGYAACTGSSPTWNCTTVTCPTETEINACITGATSGDTINIAAGTYNLTGAIAIPESKTIKLIGAGAATTIINRNSTIIQSLSDNSRISGFTINQTTGGTPSNVIYVRGTGFRIDNNIIEDKNSSTAYNACVHATAANTSPTRLPTGVIDSNTMKNCKVEVMGTAVFAKDTVFWSEASAIGTANAVYIENNTINTTDKGSVIFDCNYGARYVARYNNLYGSDAMAHSVQGDGRGCRSWELYNNTWTFDSSMFGFIAFIRGGTGMMYNNIVTGPYSGNYTIVLDNVRTFTDVGGDAGKCNGSSAWDGNDVSVGNGWPCRDQIGRGKDASLSSVTNMKAQASEPAYFWNNKRSTGANVAIDIWNSSDAWIVEGRDYFSAATYNELSQKPTGYTAYTCPHPLAATGSCDSNVAGTVGYSLVSTPSITPPSTLITASHGGGGGGSGCFIATAAYGTNLDQHVNVLSNFRDRYLLTNFVGKAFVNFYYRNSPPIADFIRRHEKVRTGMRWVLTPIVYCVEYPYITGVILIIPAGIVMVWRRKKNSHK